MSSPCVISTSYRTAHRHLRERWIERFGPLDSTDYLCHLCPNNDCENLQHVYPGSAATNMEDTVRMGRHPEASKTHCKNGHEFTEANTLWDVASVGKRVRRCRTCRATHKRSLK